MSNQINPALATATQNISPIRANIVITVDRMLENSFNENVYTPDDSLAFALNCDIFDQMTAPFPLALDKDDKPQNTFSLPFECAPIKSKIKSKRIRPRHRLAMYGPLYVIHDGRRVRASALLDAHDNADSGAMLNDNPDTPSCAIPCFKKRKTYGRLYVYEPAGWVRAPALFNPGSHP